MCLDRGYLINLVDLSTPAISTSICYCVPSTEEQTVTPSRNCFARDFHYLANYAYFCLANNDHISNIFFPVITLNDSPVQREIIFVDTIN